MTQVQAENTIKNPAAIDTEEASHPPSRPQSTLLDAALTQPPQRQPTVNFNYPKDEFESSDEDDVPYENYDPKSGVDPTSTIK